MTTQLEQEVRKAADAMNSSGVILYPTDTIWGLGCLASDKDAADKIYEIKERPKNKSMIMLVSDLKMAQKYTADIPDELKSKMLESTPTTVILKASAHCPSHLCSELGETAIRIPNDDFCKKLIRRCGEAIVSTSANRSGRPSPSIFPEIEKRILNKVDYVVNWRQDEQTPGVQSSIMKLDSGNIIQLR